MHATKYRCAVVIDDDDVEGLHGLPHHGCERVHERQTVFAPVWQQYGDLGAG